MTTNVVLVTTAFAICVADRRLSRPSGGVVSERATKITNFQCADAVGIITFNGIGRDLKGETPNDWIAAETELMRLKLDEMVERIKATTAQKLAALGSDIDKRHTFVIVGFQHMRPFTIMISNYESLETENNRLEAAPDLTIERRNDKVVFLITGVTPQRGRNVIAKIRAQLQKRPPPSVLRSRFIKIIRDVAYHGKLTGSVGTNVQSSILSPLGQFDNNGHVPGGSTVVEAPNYLTPGASYADIMIDTGPGPDGPSWTFNKVTKKAVLPEPPCKHCGNPVPKGQRRCGVCHKPAH